MLPKAAHATARGSDAQDISDEDFANAAIIAEIERIPGKSLRIKAHKGKVTLHSSHGFSATLEGGNTFTRPIPQDGNSVDTAEYWVEMEYDPAVTTTYSTDGPGVGE